MSSGLGTAEVISETVRQRPVGRLRAKGDVVHHAQLDWPLGGGIMMGSVRETDGDQWPLKPGQFGAYVVAGDIDALYARA